MLLQQWQARSDVDKVGQLGLLGNLYWQLYLQEHSHLAIRSFIITLTSGTN